LPWFLPIFWAMLHPVLFRTEGTMAQRRTWLEVFSVICDLVQADTNTNKFTPKYILYVREYFQIFPILFTSSWQAVICLWLCDCHSHLSWPWTTTMKLTCLYLLPLWLTLLGPLWDCFQRPLDWHIGCSHASWPQQGEWCCDYIINLAFFSFHHFGTCKMGVLCLQKLDFLFSY
jgi:hypothetical protein